MLGPNLVEEFILGEIIASVAVIVAFTGLSAYYSFAIGHVSKERVYKRRALWTGFLSVGLVTLILTAFFSGGTPTQPSITSQVSVVLYFIIMAAWIDSTIRTAINEDFFNRDTLLWSKVRYPFIFFVGLVAPINYLTNATDSTLTLASELAFVSSVGFLAIGIIAVYLSGTRTSIRSTRRYLKYLAFAVLCFIFQFALPTSFPFDLRAAIPFAATSYFMFKMARSLSPIRKLEPLVESISGAQSEKKNKKTAIREKYSSIFPHHHLLMTNKTLAMLAGILALVGLIVNVAIDWDNVYDMTFAGLWVVTLVMALAGAFVRGGKQSSSIADPTMSSSSSTKMYDNKR